MDYPSISYSSKVIKEPWSKHSTDTTERFCCGPAIPVVAELGLGTTLLLTHETIAAERDVPSDPVVQHAAAGPALAPQHNLLAEETPVGLLETSFVHAEAAAVTKSPLEDVLGAHAAVGGLAKEVRVLPVVLALAEDVLPQHLPPGSLEAAPQGDEHRHDDGAQSPESQAPVCECSHGRGGAAAPRALHPSKLRNPPSHQTSCEQEDVGTCPAQLRGPAGRFTNHPSPSSPNGPHVSSRSDARPMLRVPKPTNLLLAPHVSLA